MIDKIQEYVFKLFENVPQTKRVKEAREELLAGCIDKYLDLIKSGKTNEEAFFEVIAGIGDVDELLRTIVKMEKFDPTIVEDQKRKYDTISEKVKAQVTRDKSSLKPAIISSMWSFTVILYMIISFTTHYWHVTWLIFVFASVIQTVIGYIFAPSHTKHRHIHAIIWTSTTFLYFVISFFTGRWYITWVIFLIAVCIQQAFNLYVIWRRA